MTMNDKIAHFAEHFGNAFFVGSLTQRKTIYANKTARETFQITADTCDFQRIFSASDEVLREIILEHITTVSQTMIPNCTVTQGDGTPIQVDLQIGYFNPEKTEVYLEMIMKKDMSLAMSQFQVEKSLKPEVMANVDETLSIHYKNEHFNQLFQISPEESQDYLQGQLINLFPIHQRGNLLTALKKDLQSKGHYQGELEATTKEGGKIWVLVEIQKRSMNSQGQEKLMVSFLNINKRKQLEKKNTFMQQQLSAMQDLTSDFLYHIDVEEGLFYHGVNMIRHKEHTVPIADYVNVFIENKIVHPDDVEKYTSFLKEWYSRPSSEGECTIRASVVSEEYLWYTIRNKKIFDENGTLVYVMGALVNVHELHTMKKDFTNLNQYFNVLQNISGESFYNIDVEKKTLIQVGQVAEELGFDPSQPVENFPESVYHKVFPEDLQRYKDFTQQSFSGMAGETQVRVMGKTGEYRWYELICDVIYKEDGTVSEVVGKMNSIQAKKTLEERASMDLMTGVLNKVTFEEEVASFLWKEPGTHGLMFLDLDDFKDVNDSLGHSFGDSLLISVGERLRKATKEGDYIGRLGGDEFAVLMKNVDYPEVAVKSANRLLQAISAEFVFGDKKKQIKCSIGLVLTSQEETRYSDLIQKADQALYRSKEQGKNLVTVYEKANFPSL